MQPTQHSYFNNNNYSPQKLPSFATEQSQQSPFTPPKAAFDHQGELIYDLPSTSADIIQYMKKRPFTQYLGGI